MVIVQNEPWVSFLQLAAVLRRRHVRVVYVGQTRSREARVMARLLFARAESLESFLQTGFADPSIVDIQGREHDLSDLAPLLDSSRTPPKLAEIIRHRLVSLDKYEMSCRLRAAGVPVPDTLDARLIDVDKAARQLGLPLVIKNRVGAAGDGVHVAATVADARAHLESCRLEDVYYERFCSGDTYQFAAAHDGPRVLQEAVYRSVRRGGHHGPAQGVETVSDPEIRRVGAATVAAVGGRGLINLDVLLGPGGPQVVDVNLRAWDSLVPLRGAGVDFSQGYLQSLGLPVRIDGRTVAESGRIIYPHARTALTAAPTRTKIGAAWQYLRSTWRYALWLGPRYVAYVVWLLAVEFRSRQKERRAQTNRS